MESPNAAQQEVQRDEVLRFIVEQERLTKTLKHFDLTKDDLFGLLLPASKGDSTPNAHAARDTKAAKSQNQVTTTSDNKSSKRKTNNKSTPKAVEPSEVTDPSEATDTKGTKATAKAKATKATATALAQESSTKTSSKTKAAPAKSIKEKTKPSPEAPPEEPTAVEAPTKPTKNKTKATEKTKAAPTPTTDTPKPPKPPKASTIDFDDDDDNDDDLDEDKPTKSPRRQSSPRGRKSANFEPEHYFYQRLLIYTDGAARGNPGESGAGVVLKTPEGEEVGRFGKYLGRHTNNFAEYQALLLGLHHAKEFGATDITILSDSELLVRQLLGEYRVRASHLRELYEEAKELLLMFEKYQIKRIGREKNTEADSMANRAIDEKL